MLLIFAGSPEPTDWLHACTKSPTVVVYVKLHVRFSQVMDAAVSWMDDDEAEKLDLKMERTFSFCHHWHPHSESTKWISLQESSAFLLSLPALLSLSHNPSLAVLKIIFWICGGAPEFMVQIKNQNICSTTSSVSWQRSGAEEEAWGRWR